MDDELLREFLAEADERIEALFADVERLRRVHAADPRARRELVARIFRHVHTLKGSAASLPELAPLTALAHELENLLDAARNGRAPLTGAAINACEDATQALSLLLERAARGDAALDAPPAIIEQLRHQAATRAHASTSPDEPAHPTRGDARPSPEEIARALPEEIARSLSAVERRHLAECIGEGARAVVVSVAFDLATLDDHFGRFTNALGECGELISTFPGEHETAAPGEISFHILYAVTCTRAELETRLAAYGARLAWTSHAREAHDAQAGEAGVPAAVESYGDEGGEAGANRESGDGEELSGDDAPEHVGDARAPVFVRVPLRELDELVAATHELFGETLALLEQAGTTGAQAKSSGSPSHASGETHAGAASAEAERVRRLREDFGALEERVMALRMQPLLPVLERAARAARIAARAAGKEIDLVLVGGEVRVDRSLAEQIGEPLLHLLRNAIDHGIEPADERRAAGKRVRGSVRLEVSAEGSRVRVRVADDGRGIDTERVARAAAAQGLIAAGAHVTEEHALRLIFRPGFSTAGRVSDVSGRGVGLDVVEHSLERAGGELRVRTRRGEGTTFELRVPLALALVRVLVVRAGGHAYALDVNYMIATVELERVEIARDDEGRSSVLLDGEQVPLVWLRSLLGGAAQPPDRASDEAREPVRACVVRREREDAEAWRRGESEPEHFIIAVDEIEGEREALVRSLGRHATRWRGVGGAFEQRDGTVALLLDLPKLLRRRGDERQVNASPI